MLHTRLADPDAQLGDSEEAVRPRRAALPVLDRLEADDDAVQTALAARRLRDRRSGGSTRPKAWIAEIDAHRRRRDRLRWALACRAARAELALARGTGRRGPAPLPGAPSASLAALQLPGDGRADRAGAVGPVRRERRRRRRSPSTATDADAARGRPLFAALLAKAPCACSTRDRPLLDYPVAGLVLLRARRLGPAARGGAAPDDAVQLLVLAERFGYNRFIPTMAWERTAPRAEGARPGGSPRPARRAYGDRRGPEPARRGPRPRRAARCRELHLARVGAHRQRREDRDDRGAAEQRPADLGGDAAVGHRSRTAVTTWETGLTFTNVCSQPGIVSAGHERVGQERQREQDHHRDALDGLRRCARSCRTR